MQLATSRETQYLDFITSDFNKLFWTFRGSSLGEQLVKMHERLLLLEKQYAEEIHSNYVHVEMSKEAHLNHFEKLKNHLLTYKQQKVVFAKTHLIDELAKAAENFDKKAKDSIDRIILLINEYIIKVADLPDDIGGVSDGEDEQLFVTSHVVLFLYELGFFEKLREEHPGIGIPTIARIIRRLSGECHNRGTLEREIKYVEGGKDNTGKNSVAAVRRVEGIMASLGLRTRRMPPDTDV